MFLLLFFLSSLKRTVLSSQNREREKQTKNWEKISLLKTKTTTKKAKQTKKGNTPHDAQWKWNSSGYNIAVMLHGTLEAKSVFLYWAGELLIA